MWNLPVDGMMNKVTEKTTIKRCICYAYYLDFQHFLQFTVYC